MRLLTGEREGSSNVLLPHLPHIAPADRDASGLRVEEAEEESCHGRLAGTALSDERDPAAGLDPQVKFVQHGSPTGLVAHGHSLQRDGSRTGGYLERRVRVDDQYGPVDQLENAAARTEGGSELLRRPG